MPAYADRIERIFVAAKKSSRLLEDADIQALL